MELDLFPELPSSKPEPRTRQRKPAVELLATGWETEPYVKPLGEPPDLAYDLAQSLDANANWDATCGPHALAAAIGATLEQLRPIFAVCSYKGWTSPAIMEKALRFAQVAWSVHELKTQEPGHSSILRVQWEGSWLNPGVPIAAAYAHTHWIAHKRGWVLCTAIAPATWIPFQWWKQEVERLHPWHFTHHYHAAPFDPAAVAPHI